MPLSIDEVRELGDPQRSYKWKVILPEDIPIPKKTSSRQNRGEKDYFKIISNTKSIVSGDVNVDTVGGVLGVDSFKTHKVSAYVEEVQGLPFNRISSEAFYEGGSNTYFPGMVDIDRVTLVFYQNESSTVPEYIQAWKNLVVLPTGLKNLPSVYKKYITIYLLNGLHGVTFAYKLYGAFPTTTVPYDLDNTSNRIKFTQEFSVDRGELLDPRSEPDFLSSKAKERRLRLNTIGTLGEGIIRKGSNLKELASSASNFLDKRLPK